MLEATFERETPRSPTLETNLNENRLSSLDDCTVTAQTAFHNREDGEKVRTDGYSYSVH